MDPLRIDPTEIVERLRLRGEDWADKNAAAELLEETRKTFLAEVTAGHLRSGEGIGKAETLALTSPNYREHLEKMVEARRHANRARVAYDSGRVFAELLRTKAATERAQMDLR